MVFPRRFFEELYRELVEAAGHAVGVEIAELRAERLQRHDGFDPSSGSKH